MFYQGLADYHGHVSARIPGTRRFFIKPVLAPLGEIAPKHIIEVDIDEYMEVCEQNYAKAGNKRAVTKVKNPPRETMIHASIYNARPDVNSVVHTHQTSPRRFRWPERQFYRSITKRRSSRPKRRFFLVRGLFIPFKTARKFVRL